MSPAEISEIPERDRSSIDENIPQDPCPLPAIGLKDPDSVIDSALKLNRARMAEQEYQQELDDQEMISDYQDDYDEEEDEED